MRDNSSTGYGGFLLLSKSIAMTIKLSTASVNPDIVGSVQFAWIVMVPLGRNFRRHCMDMFGAFPVFAQCNTVVIQTYNVTLLKNTHIPGSFALLVDTHQTFEAILLTVADANKTHSKYFWGA